MGYLSRGDGAGRRTVEVAIFEKMVDLYRKSRSLQPAWLRDFFSTVGAHRAFIWGKGARQRPHIKGSGQRPTSPPLTHPFRTLQIKRFVKVSRQTSFNTLFSPLRIRQSSDVFVNHPRLGTSLLCGKCYQLAPLMRCQPHPQDLICRLLHTHLSSKGQNLYVATTFSMNQRSNRKTKILDL